MENYNIEMAQGRLGRIIALRLTPGTDVLLGLTEACKRAGIDTVIVDRYEAESLDEAIRFARAANAKHGERLSREELRENILAYLRAGGDKESDSAIAAAFGIHRKTVATGTFIFMLTGSPSGTAAKTASTSPTDS